MHGMCVAWVLGDATLLRARRAAVLQDDGPFFPVVVGSGAAPSTRAEYRFGTALGHCQRTPG
ncbi:MAG: hypothetical protein ACRDQ6_23015, partial [Pseudonocardiaceae bacterium]